MILTVIVVDISASAIPMWEFLSRSEKMSHLFNTFVKQVAAYCDSSNMPDCNKVLLIHGITNLAKMDDESLDKMDPYQRGANDIIWESMMKGSYKTSILPKNTEHDYYADALEPSTNENHLGAESNNVEEIAGAPNYPMGPMVIRVMPDGSPVPGDNQKVPTDEDIEEHLAMRANPVPSVSDIMKQKSPRSTLIESDRLVAQQRSHLL